MVAYNRYSRSHDILGADKCRRCGLDDSKIRRRKIMCGDPCPPLSRGTGPKQCVERGGSMFCLTPYGKDLVASQVKHANAIAGRFAKDFGCDFDEAIEEGHLQLIRLAAHCKPHRGQFGTLVYACLRRKLVSWHKAMRIGRQRFNRNFAPYPVDMLGVEVVPDDSPPLDDACANRELVRMILSGADELAPHFRDHFMCEYTLTETAERHGENKRTVISRVNRRVDLIRQELGIAS